VGSQSAPANFGFDYLWKCINHSPNAAGATMSRLSSTKITPIGRFDSRLNGHTWTILNWWWRRLSNQMPSCMQPRHGHPQLYALICAPRDIQIADHIDQNIHASARASSHDVYIAVPLSFLECVRLPSPSRSWCSIHGAAAFHRLV